ncbi:Pimeloyl-ACP methyl ester carboxylesterase [Chitinophaga sp. CF118]|uniref:alpha/beta fold hydrolase n=1 Tax=Chitinophaga sp. CF118 TaxID=1884367 RepID=UPI0008E20362|nr:alpha/beta hydrolase [Chitinophaga sp. CF118]SFD83094.1 Pimeloyl-ACP methyl ester carboxylesterase [Chitinophaga sp. CF118]
MKTSLLMLHGAIGASSQLKAIAEQLSINYEVHLFDFPGHGGKDLPVEPFSIKLFSDAVLSYIQKNNLQKLTIFGYSMGGYVAMYLAKHHPQLVDRVVTLGTKFHWNETIAAKEIKMLDTAAIATKVPAFAAALAEMHAPNDWKEVVLRTADLLAEMGKDNPLKPDDYKEIKIPSLILLGDRDKMVTFEETIATYKNLPDAQMGVLPGTPHIIEQVNPSLVTYFI